VVATGFDSDYSTVDTARPAVDETPAVDMKDEKPEAEAKEFAEENKTNMWDSIKNEPEPEPEPQEDDEMDVPPSLRERLRNRRKKD
jgi:hypothetical protein